MRLELPSHLDQHEEVIEADDIPADAKKIGEAITELLEYEPAITYVHRIVRPKYIVGQYD